MTVTFIGHSNIDITPQLKQWLYEQINALILEGATTFLCGGYGHFDELSAYITRHCREYYPEINQILVHPYPNRPHDTTIYSDGLYPQLDDVTKTSAIPKRNEWLVNNADVVVAYVFETYGGAYKSLTYANKNNKRVIQYSFPD